MAERPPWCQGDVKMLGAEKGQRLVRKKSCRLRRCPYFVPQLEGVDILGVQAEGIRQTLQEEAQSELFGNCSRWQASRANEN